MLRLWEMSQMVRKVAHLADPVPCALHGAGFLRSGLVNVALCGHGAVPVVVVLACSVSVPPWMIRTNTQLSASSCLNERTKSTSNHPVGVKGAPWASVSCAPEKRRRAAWGRACLKERDPRCGEGAGHGGRQF